MSGSSAAEAAGASSSSDPEAGGPRSVVQDEEITRRPPCFFRYFGIIVRVWGFLTVAALCVSTWWLVERKSEYPYTAWYTMAAVIVIGLLELIWLINFCAICRDEGGLCCTFWRLFVWIDNWRKTIIYCLLAVPEFVIAKPALVPFVAGSLIALLGILYLFKTCETCRCCQGEGYSETRPRDRTKASNADSSSSKRRSTKSSSLKDNSKETSDNSGLIRSAEGQ